MTRSIKSPRSTSRSGGSSLDEFLLQLAKRLSIPDADIVTGDEAGSWPKGKVDELVAADILQEIQPGTTVVCDECDECCSIEPQRRTHRQSGKMVGVYICTHNPDMGRIEIDPNRLRRWRINRDKLKELGLLKKKAKRRTRRSSALTPREQEVYRKIHVENKTQSRVAYELDCSPQNVSKLLNKADVKMGLGKSRSVSLSKAHRLPEDKRGQVDVITEDEGILDDEA